jgi:hypothetical protein
MIRAKGNLQFRRMFSNIINKDNGVLPGQIGNLTGFYTFQNYPEKLRRIRFYDEAMDNDFEFLPNKFSLQA